MGFHAIMNGRPIDIATLNLRDLEHSTCTIPALVIIGSDHVISCFHHKWFFARAPVQ